MDKIILGTVQFGLNYGINNQKGKVSKAEVFKILDEAYREGVRVLDTADAYGNAIELIGEYHQQSVHKFHVISKFKKEAHTTDTFVEHIRGTIVDMHIDKLHAFLFHSYQDFVQHPQFLEKLISVKKEGFIENIGLSLYTNEEIESIIDHEDIDIIQVPYNLLDNDAQKGDLLKRARQAGKIIHTRSVFLQGLFFKDISSLPEYMKLLAKPLSDISGLLAKYDTSTAALAMRYTLSKNYIDGMLIGVDSLAQIKENFEALKKEISSEVYKDIDSIKLAETELLNPVNWK